MGHLGRLLESRQRSLGLRPVDIARRAGYRNTNKGVRRYCNIEAGESIFSDKRILRCRLREPSRKIGRRTRIGISRRDNTQLSWPEAGVLWWPLSVEAGERADWYDADSG